MSATNPLHHPVIKAVCVDTASGMYGGSASLIVYSGCIHAESDIATKMKYFSFISRLSVTLLFVAINMTSRVFGCAQLFFAAVIRIIIII